MNDKDKGPWRNAVLILPNGRFMPLSHCFVAGVTEHQFKELIEDRYDPMLIVPSTPSIALWDLIDDQAREKLELDTGHHDGERWQLSDYLSIDAK